MTSYTSYTSYSATDAERWVPEQRTASVADGADTSELVARTPYERDRARVLHSAALRRLAAKTQVHGPGTNDFVRNRLTHSLEVAQVGRELGKALGCDPDLVDAACLSHDLGHPPFGHNGERALNEAAASCGGFEGNAQTLRVLTRLEAKRFAPDGRSVGLNLTRATLDAATKYPWPRGTHPGDPKFGVYADDAEVFAWVRAGVPGQRLCVEAQVMDLADDIAYCVHDVEDGVQLARTGLAELLAPGERASVIARTIESYAPDAAPAELAERLEALVALPFWVGRYDGSRAALAALKNMTSGLIGRFCGSVERATRAQHGAGPLVRHDADVVVPRETRLEIALLKGIAARYFIYTDERVHARALERELVWELIDLIVADAPHTLAPALAADWHAASDEAARLRVVIDQVASLTDLSAVTERDHLRAMRKRP